MSPLTVCAFAVVAVGMIAVIRQARPELASLAVAAAGVLMLVYIVSGIAPFVEEVRDAAKGTGAESYFTLLLKALAVALCCQLSAEICRDCGESALASRVELAGKLGIVVMSLPVIKQLLETAKDLMG